MEPVALEDASRGRNPEQSRKAILEAAEALFAERGYEATSLKEIGERAGVSRGTPAYFYGSKEGLYQAVMERLFAKAEALIREAEARAAMHGGDLEALLSETVDRYVDFLSAHPQFIRLIERESLREESRFSQLPPHVAAVQAGLAAARPHLRAELDPRQVLLSVMGLCWFPLSQSRTLLPVLGFDARDPEFLAALKRHVVALMLNGLAPR